MNFKTTVVMLVLLAGIAGAYLWMRSAGPPDTSPTAELPTAFVTGRAFDVVTIEQAGQLIKLEEQERGWWQTAPVRFPVTGDAVENLINTGLSLTPREVFSFSGDDPLATNTDQALGSFGLDPPRATVTYRRSDTGEYRLHLGNTNVAGSAYLQVDGDDGVYLVDTALHEAILGVEARAWRPTTLPTLDPGRVNRIVITGSQPDLELSRTAEGWSLRPDGGERADDQLALELATLTQQISPGRYVNDDPAALGRYGLAPPRATLTTADATGAQHTLRLGQPGDLNNATVYATWSDTAEPSPVVFLLPAMPLGGLPQLTADQLRDPRVVIARPGSIRGQKVTRVGRDTVNLQQRADGGLAFAEPQTGYAPDAEKAADWLTTLTRIAPVGHTRAPREAQAPIALVELQLTGGRSEHVRLYADRDGRDDVVLVVRENESVAGLIPRDQVAPLLAPVVTLRDRRLPDAGQISELRLTRDDGEMFSFTRDDGRWSPQNPDFTRDWEAERFDELSQWVNRPRVASWTPRPELPRGPIARLSLGDNRPAYAVNIEQNLGQRTDLPGVFRLPPDIAALFAAEYRKRLLLPYRPDQITRVVLGILPFDDAPTELPSAAVVTLNPQGIYETAAGQRYENQADCAALFNVLAGLSAKRIVPALSSTQQQTPIKFWRLDTDDGQTHRLTRYNQGIWSLNDETYFLIDVEIDRQLTRKETAWGQALILPDAP